MKLEAFIILNDEYGFTLTLESKTLHGHSMMSDNKFLLEEYVRTVANNPIKIILEDLAVKHKASKG